MSGFTQKEKFADIKYERPDFEAVKKATIEYMESFKKAQSYQEARKLFLDFQKSNEHLSTMMTVASIRNTCDTGDKFYDDEMSYINEKAPELGPIGKEADMLLLSSPFKADFEAEYGSLFIKNMEVGQKLESDEIIPERIEEAQLSQEYSKLVAQCNVDFDGEQCNFYGLLKHMQSTDRDERKRAFAAWAKMYDGVSQKLDSIFDRLIDVRTAMAKKLGFASYTEYAYLANGRYDYTADDVKKFHEYVKKYITPACAKLREIQRARLGVKKLHYYDEALLFPEGNEKPVGSMAELVAKAQKMYREMSKETGEFFDFMNEHELFDLESKPGKHMGGYCTFLPEYRAPFIFSNFNGTSADVDVLTHEAGHAFESFVASKNLPLLEMTWSTSEINEIHSMTMELFAYPWMESFFGDADKYRYLHLTEGFGVLPYFVCVDEFQHRVYDNPNMTSQERYTVWRDLEKEYMPWRDYDGNEFLEKGGFWMQKQHIFLYPFYYIEYGLAQVCAFQYYVGMKKDRDKTWADYLKLCKAGGSEGYFKLLEIGRLDNPFKEETIKKVAENIMAELL